MCRKLGVARSAYCRWKKSPKSLNELENSRLAGLVEKIHTEHPDMGYRRICDELNARYGEPVNDKRILRICRMKKIQSSIKWKPSSCTRASKDALHIQGNILNREFSAERPDQKWLTDVSEFKYSANGETRKIYLSAILDLYDRRIVAYRIDDRNDNPIVMNTFKEHSRKNRMPVRSAIATEDSSIRVRSSIRLCRAMAASTACPGLPIASTMARWKASGEYSRGRCTTARNSTARTAS